MPGHGLPDMAWEFQWRRLLLDAETGQPLQIRIVKVVRLLQGFLITSHSVWVALISATKGRQSAARITEAITPCWLCGWRELKSSGASLNYNSILPNNPSFQFNQVYSFYPLTSLLADLTIIHLFFVSSSRNDSAFTGFSGPGGNERIYWILHYCTLDACWVVTAHSRAIFGPFQMPCFSF